MPRPVKFPDPDVTHPQTKPDDHKVKYMEGGHQKHLKLSDVDSAAYAIYGKSKFFLVAKGKGGIASGNCPEIVLVEGKIVVESPGGADGNQVIAGTDVAVAQASGSKLTITVQNPGQGNREVHTFRYNGQGTARIVIRNNPVNEQTTNQDGHQIQVTFDQANNPVLGTWGP